MTGKQNFQWEESFEANNLHGEGNYLILYNDDVHDFDFVIKSLVEICGHTNVQAEQCTYLVHYKGKCDVKKGSYHELKSMQEELVDRGLQAALQ